MVGTDADASGGAGLLALPSGEARRTGPAASSEASGPLPCSSHSCSRPDPIFPIFKFDRWRSRLLRRIFALHCATACTYPNTLRHALADGCLLASWDSNPGGTQSLSNQSFIQSLNCRFPCVAPLTTLQPTNPPPPSSLPYPRRQDGATCPVAERESETRI